VKKYQFLATLFYLCCATCCSTVSSLNASTLTTISAIGDVSVAKANATLSTSETVGVGEAPYSWGVDKDETRLAETRALQNAVESWVVNHKKPTIKITKM
jgi:hypothetical protein